MVSNTTDIEKALWEAADQLRAAEAHALEERIADNMRQLLNGD